MRIKLPVGAFVVVVCLTTGRLHSPQAGPVREEVVEPVLTEETLPEEQDECNLRTSIDYRAPSLEPSNALPRLQLFCGLFSRWGAEVDIPFAYPDQRLNHTAFGDVMTTLKYRVKPDPASQVRTAAAC